MKIEYYNTASPTILTPWMDSVIEYIGTAARAIFPEDVVESIRLSVDKSHTPEFSARPGGILINDSVFIESRDYDVPRIGRTDRRPGYAVYIVATDEEGDNPDLLLSQDALRSPEEAAAAAVLLFASNMIDRAIEGETFARVHGGYAQAVTGVNQKSMRLLNDGLRRSQ
jgi:hypothetical protein